MKKFLLLPLVIALLLCGCSANGGDGETIPPRTEPIQYYEPDSAVEQDTHGAIMMYNIPNEQYHWMEVMGDSVLLASGEDMLQLRLVDPANGALEAEAALPMSALRAYSVLADGIVYYDAVEHSAIFMDASLQRTRAVSLPAELTGPMFSPDGKEIFYTLGNDIRSYHFETKLTRLVKSQTAEKQVLRDIVFDGQILICEIYSADGVAVQYISAQNGQTLTVNSNILSLDSYGEMYFLLRREGGSVQNVVGQRDGQAYEVSNNGLPFFSALELGGVVACDAADAAVKLSYCDIASGRNTSTITYHRFAVPEITLCDANNKCIWLLVKNDLGATGLLRWNVAKSTVENDAVYVSTLYTAQAPDEQALKEIGQRVEDLNSKYGVKIRIWQDAVSVPEGHKLEVEYQPSVISAVLDELESVLNEFPKKFVYKSISSRVRICIVRSIDGKQQGLQYWSDKYAFIAITPETDIRSEFMKAFGFVVDSHVLGNSPIYDYWTDLNPEGFSYGSTVDAALLSGEGRAFVDQDSAISGTYDRSRIFWAAMQADNAEMFANEIMQGKLTMVCKAIRDAWRLEDSTDIFPWEQYLNQAVAAKKK